MLNLNDGLAVDAAHSEKKKTTEYQGIDLSTGEVVFYKNIGHQTTNIGEFLALVEGIKYVIEHENMPMVVFSDSNTAISWVKNRGTSSVKRNKLIDKAIIYLKACSVYVNEVDIIKWDTKAWGENPADFGNK